MAASDPDSTPEDQADHATPDPAGDFAAIYDQHARFIWRSLRALGVAEQDVEDAVQDTFAAAARRLDEFEGRSSLRTWLFAIARRTALHYRRRHGRKGGGQALDQDYPDREQPSPREETEKRQAAALLAQLLDTLDDDKRVVFVLVELEGMAIPEVASTLGIKLNTAYSRLHAARKRFNRAVDRHLARENQR